MHQKNQGHSKYQLACVSRDAEAYSPNLRFLPLPRTPSLPPLSKPSLSPSPPPPPPPLPRPLHLPRLDPLGVPLPLPLPLPRPLPLTTSITPSSDTTSLSSSIATSKNSSSFRSAAMDICMKSYATMASPPPHASLACRSISAMTAKRES
ncbi:hypothetical protein EDD22DRAFT_371327 [Suillus occidentalis]|nr:hypothetical protein EDD22DRAFT_371327 [Suillus occidentalis]